MSERERILQLVRDGVLSVDEGLDLLESIANKETEETAHTEFTSENEHEDTIKETKEESTEEKSTKETSDTEKEENKTERDRKTTSDFEDELEDLANQLNKYSVKIDEINEEITDLRSERSEIQEHIEEIKEHTQEDYKIEKDALENKIANLHKEIELVTSIEHVDNYEEIQSLKTELTKTMEELSQLKNSEETNEETNKKIKKAEEKLKPLEEKIQDLTTKKDHYLKEMHSLKMKQWTTKAKQVSEKIDIPEDWRENTNKTIDKAGNILDETSKTLGDALRKTIQTTKNTLENINWKDLDLSFDINKKMEHEFDHEWTFENTTATILDFKNANGNIQFKPSTNDDIKINANIKLYGKMDEASPLAAFEARSTINLDEDKFVFHIPNKNIIANMIIYLPKREYDYIRSNSFNGNVKFDDINTRDIYIKTTNGDIIFDKLEATMLEIKGTNGDITLNDALLRDLLIGTVNGDIRILGDIQSSDIHTTNGTIRLTLKGEDLIRVAGGSVNGDVKISFPESTGLEIEAKSVFGKVRSRLSNTNSTLTEEVKGKVHTFYRVGQDKICRTNVSTTTGNILFKDTDEV